MQINTVRSYIPEESCCYQGVNETKMGPNHVDNTNTVLILVHTYISACAGSVCS